MAFVIIHIGEIFNPQTEFSHKAKALRYKVGRPPVARDGTTFIRRYLITINDELFCSTEYTSRLTAGKHIHVIQLDDAINSLPQDWRRDKFNELILTQRVGRSR